MTNIACDVASESPLSEHLVSGFRTSPQALYQALRDANEIDTSRVNQRFSERLIELLPRTSPGFRRVIEALRWGETAELAERWIAGEELDEIDKERIGAQGAGSLSSRGTTIIIALAALCRELRRPFAFFVDEFEHLARYDRRHASRRNTTWLKRLIEGLAREHAMVFVSGHWEAWEQQGDFLDRFMGSPPIRLVRLTASDITKIVQIRAPDWQLFSQVAAEAVIDVTGGNIRRAMTVLYDLYADRRTRLTGLSRIDVVAASERRLQRGDTESIWPSIEAAAQAQGATMEREAVVLDRRVDAAIRVDNAVRVLVEVKHEREEGLLLEAGEKFADFVQRVKQTTPDAQGLFVALGAVNAEHLKRLDAARGETEVVNGEALELPLRLTEVVTKALAPKPPSDARQPVADEQLAPLRRELNQVREELLKRSEAQLARAVAMFGTDQRSAAVRASVVESPAEIDRQRGDIAMRAAAERIISDERRSAYSHYLSTFLLPVLAAVCAIFILIFAPDISYTAFPYGDTPIRYSFTLLLRIVSLFGLVGFAYYIVRKYAVISRYQNYRMSIIQQFREMQSPPRALAYARDIMDKAVAKAGYNRAIEAMEEDLHILMEDVIRGRF
jgi:hypothetical protein